MTDPPCLNCSWHTFIWLCTYAFKARGCAMVPRPGSGSTAADRRRRHQQLVARLGRARGGLVALSSRWRLLALLLAGLMVGGRSILHRQLGRVCVLASASPVRGGARVAVMRLLFRCCAGHPHAWAPPLDRPLTHISAGGKMSQAPVCAPLQHLSSALAPLVPPGRLDLPCSCTA